MVLQGVGVSPGRAVGPVVLVAESLPAPPATPPPEDPAEEARRIRPAAHRVAATLSVRAEAVHGQARRVLETTAMMAADPALLAKAEELVSADRLPAARAVFEAVAGFADTLRAAGGYLAERVRDLEDVRDRLVADLLGTAPPGVPELSTPSVLVARDLAPADTAGLDRATVLALVTEEGGPTSHTAILARALGIPAVVACRGVLATAPRALVVDGVAGTVEVPTGDVVTVAADRPERSEWNGFGATADGRRVKVLANVGSAADALAASEAGAEGVGLFRTEFCYLDAATEPGAQPQQKAYAEVLAPFHGKPVIVRTLDAGADKPLAFLGLAAEPNPALGVRGLRVALAQTGLLDRQLAAIVAAAAETAVDLSVMAPMVATPDEAAWFAERARAHGVPSVGVMIEIPSAALLAREFLEVVDFVSVGTNDLAQYTLAADRQIGALATYHDPWQPALLRLLSMVGEAATTAYTPFGVCGEAAADPLMVPVLVGLGVTSLSANPAALPSVGAALAKITEDTCRLAARAVLAARTPADARAAAHAVVG